MEENESLVMVAPERLSPAALRGLVEEFVLRAGTDYGAHEVPFADKCAQVQAQLRRGEIGIAFDVDAETANLVRLQDLLPARGRCGQAGGETQQRAAWADRAPSTTKECSAPDPRS